MAGEFKKETQMMYSERLDDLLEQLPSFCSTFFAQKRKLSAVTAATYGYDLRQFFLYLALNNSYYGNRIKVYEVDGNQRLDSSSLLLSDLENITADDIGEFTAFLEKKKGLQKLTIEHYLSAISSLWEFFIKRRDLPPYNPVDAIDRVKRDKEHIVRLTREEKDIFLNTIEFGEGLTKKQLQYHVKNKARDYAIYKLFLSTGMRVSELVGIDISDIDFEDCSINVVRKGGKEQKLFFSDGAADAINSYLVVRNSTYKPVDGEDALFLGPQGKRLSIRSVQKLTTKYVNAALAKKNDKITTHKLRSTFATLMLEETHDIKRVAGLLGHENVVTTEHYAAYLNEDNKNLRNLVD